VLCAIRTAFATGDSQFGPRKALISATKAARSVCKERFVAFGTAGHADRNESRALEALAQRYWLNALKSLHD
jgi:fructose-bisphosphate aldolase class II